MVSYKLDFKMKMLKDAINFIAPRVLRLSSGVQPKTPQSKLILSVWARLEDALKKETSIGYFNDKNFSKLLESTKQALIFLCENDRYYKRWLSLFAFILKEELEKQYDNFTFPEALDMTVRPLGLTYEEFEKHRKALWEFHMTGYLSALSRQPLPTEKKEGFNLETSDPQAYIRVFCPYGEQRPNGNFFTLTLRDRDEHSNSKS